MYFLWERSDGYIGATQNGGNGPQPIVGANGKVVTFEVIASFANWDQREVEARIKSWKALKGSSPPAVSEAHPLAEVSA